MIVELFGLPASGKTALAKFISGKNGWEIIKTGSRSELVLYNLLFLIRHPVKFFALLGWLLRYAGSEKLLYLKLMNLFFSVNARYQKARLKKKAILDQGYFQNILSLFDHQVSTAILKKYADVLPKPDAMIVLDAPSDERLKREEVRGYFTREKMGKPYLEQWKKSIESNFAEFIKILPSLGFPSRVVDSKRTTDEIFFEIEHLFTVKIAYVTNVRLPTEKAHGLQVMKTCEAFADAGASLELIVPRGRNSLGSDPFAYYGVKDNFKIKKILSLNLFTVSLIPKYAAFYIQSFSFSLAGVMYALFKSEKGAVFYSRDYITLFLLSLLGLRPVAEIHDYRLKKPSKIVSFILRKAPKVVVNSEGTLEQLRAHYDVEPGRIITAPNGVDIKFFDIGESQSEARRKLGMPEGFIVGYVGRMESAGMEKGVPLLLRSFKRISKKHPDSILYIVGGPESLVDAYRREYIDDELRDSVVFTGQVEYEKIPMYLRAMDAVVIPLPINQHSLTTSPVKLFEFLAAGKTIIASDLPSLRVYLNNNNALLFNPENEEGLAERLEQAIIDHDTALRLSRQAKIDSKQYSWQDRAERIIKYIDNLS